MSTIPVPPILGPCDATCQPSETDKAYAAGFFDGEGHITIAFMSRKLRTKGNVYTMRVGAAQNELGPLLWLRERWSGSVSATKRLTGAGNQTFKWNLCSRKAAKFLRDVLPHLLVKRRRADIAIRFQEFLFIPGKNGHTDQYRAALEAMRFEMTGLNTHKFDRSAKA
jgi:hypothetical protein